MLKLQAAYVEFDRLQAQVYQLLDYIDCEPDPLAREIGVLRLGIYASGMTQLHKIIEAELDLISLDDLLAERIKK